MLSIVVKLYFIAPIIWLIAVSLFSRLFVNSRGRTENVPTGELFYWYVRAYVILLLYVAIYIFALPAHLLRIKAGYFKEKLPQTEGEQPVIILVHAYLAMPAHWTVFKYFLKRRGYRDIIFFDYSSYRGSMGEWSLSLKKIAERYTRRGVVFIGHSLGGLVAVRTAAQMPKGTASVITLGSPLGGTEMARLAVTANARNLLPGSEDIRKTIELIESNRFELTCYWSKFDNIIIPSKSAAPPQGKSVEVEGISHAGFLFLDVEP